MPSPLTGSPHCPQPALPAVSPCRAPRVRCFVVEDSDVIRHNLIATLEEMLAMNVVGSARSEAEALTWMSGPAGEADLLIIDIFLQSGSGLGVLAQAAELMPASRRVVLTNFATPDMRRRCLALGADRVFDKSSELDELIAYCDALQED